MNLNSPLSVTLKFVTNFQPNFSYIFSKSGKFPLFLKKNKNNKICCKNFLIYLCLMNYVFDNQEISVFVQPFYSNTINILRAPYKNKISKHQVTLSRYVVITKIMFFDNLGKNYTSIPSVCHQINFLKNQLSFFESNVAFQHKSTVKLNLILNGYFNADFFLKQT